MTQMMIKHVMDEKPREMSLDEAFLEALQLSEGQTNEFEKQEYELYEYLSKHPDFVFHISDEYKRKVLKNWDYEVLS